MPSNCGTTACSGRTGRGANDKCYVSNAHGCGKGSGDLFRLVAEDLGVSLAAITHRGNNFPWEIEPARKAGCEAIHLDAGNLNRFERLMETHQFATGGLASAFAGASRLARLGVDLPEAPHVNAGLAAADLHPRLRAIRDVAAGVAAPSLTAFVLWVLRRAERLGLRRLYFLARDGEVMLEIARRLAPQLGLDGIELHYLYGNRKSWALTGLFDTIRYGDLDWAWDGSPTVTVRSFLHKVGLKPDPIRKPLLAAGFDEAAWDTPLTDDQRITLWHLLHQEAAAVDALLAEASRRRELLVEYLEGEGVLRDDRWAMVDLGWKGSMQAALKRVLDRLDKPEPIGFYFGLGFSTGDGTRLDLGHAEGYFYDEHRGVGRLATERLDLALLTEMFCVANHGTCRDYRRDADTGRVEPVLKSPEEDARDLEAWGFDTMRATVVRFVESLWLDEELVRVEADLVPMVDDLMIEFRERITPAEAEAWGRFPVETGVSADAVQQLGPPYRLGDAWRSFVNGQADGAPVADVVLGRGPADAGLVDVHHQGRA